MLNFRIFSAALVAMAMASSAQAQAEGPFGFVMGDPIGDYSCVLMDGIWAQCDAPRPHSGFATYAVQATPDDGICYVKGIGKDISTNGYGATVKRQVDTIAAQIRTTYGSPDEKTDFLVYGSIWDDRDDWMMAIAQDERFYWHKWKDVGVRSVKDIFVAAKASHSNSGYVVVEFYGTNYDSCENYSNMEESAAF